MDRATAVLEKIEREADAKSLPIIGPEKGVFLDDAVRAAKPRRSLEVGTLVGYSAIRIARLLPKDGRLVCVELNPGLARVAERNLESAGLEGKVEVRVGDAKKVLTTLTGEFDFVFLDAAKEEYLTYLRLVEPRLHTGSIVVADNAGVFADAMEDFLRYVRNSRKYASEYHEMSSDYHPGIKDGVEVSVRR